jgi:Domain of unknown function (DUF4351)
MGISNAKSFTNMTSKGSSNSSLLAERIIPKGEPVLEVLPHPSSPIPHPSSLNLMSRTPFDSFSKQLLESFLVPLGEVYLNQEVPGESRFVDLRFVPFQEPTDREPLGLLGKIAATPCLLEPFRNPPSTTDVRNCLLKLFLAQAELQRQAKREERSLPDSNLPQLWILAPSASDDFLAGFTAQPHPDWLTGIYFLGSSLKCAIVDIKKLPKTSTTLWLRLLGKGKTQEQAIREVLALPKSDPRRASVLQLLVSWKISLQLNAQLEQEEVNLMAVLLQAYQEWEQATEQRGIEQGIEQGIERGERSLILKQLTRRIGQLPEAVRSQIGTLSIAHLESLGEALLDFANLTDLETWLATNVQTDREIS